MRSGKLLRRGHLRSHARTTSHVFTRQKLNNYIISGFSKWTSKVHAREATDRNIYFACFALLQGCAKYCLAHNFSLAGLDDRAKNLCACGILEAYEGGYGNEKSSKVWWKLNKNYCRSGELKATTPFSLGFNEMSRCRLLLVCFVCAHLTLCIQHHVNIYCI